MWLLTGARLATRPDPDTTASGAVSYLLEPAGGPEVAVLLNGTVKIMTPMTTARRPLPARDAHRRRRRRGRHSARAMAAVAAICAALLSAGCSTGQPKPIAAAELAE